MGSYGVIKEALLVKKNGETDEYSVVQKLVPATVNGMVMYTKNNDVSISSVYHGGAFGLSKVAKNGDIFVSVNIPGYGVKYFRGVPFIQNENGVGKCVICIADVPDPNAPYTHLCLVVESPGNVFAENANP